MFGGIKGPKLEILQTRDDNFEFIKSKIPEKIDVLFIDTLHEADHVEKIIHGYYNLVKTDGYIFIDDISHLPYLKNSKRDNFYCEINNLETFKRILEIYSNNINNFDLNFNFTSSGLAILKKEKLQCLIKVVVLFCMKILLKYNKKFKK